jgi:diguanylate cyclase (GGDEF)-like protein
MQRYTVPPRPLPTREFSDEDAGDFAVTAAANLRYWRAVISVIGASWLIDTLLITGFAWAGTVPFGVAMAYAFAGLSWCGTFHLVTGRWAHTRQNDSALTVSLLASCCFAQLLFLYLAPAISFYFLLVLFIVFGFGAMGLSLMQGGIALTVTLTGVALLMRNNHAVSWIPHATSAGRWLSFAGYATTLARCMLLGVYKQSMRLRNQKKRRELTASVLRQDKTLGLVHAELQYQANHDALTGLPNRSKFAGRLEEAIREGHPFSIAIIDLDRFKIINDSLGHAAGDELLRLVAQRLLLSVRSQDLVARAGGDEFMLLIHGVSQRTEVEVLARRWMDVVCEPYRIHSTDLNVSPSIGIARFPQDAFEAQKLVARADEAMYHAKANGKNAFHFFDGSVASFSRERLVMESDLRRALAESELFLEYQPRVAIGTNQIESVEALVRWRHPTRGRLMPGEFVAIAEDTGLILSIGKWVIEEACRQAKQWQAQGLPFLRIAVNVSPIQFRDKEFLSGLERALRSNVLDARYLEIELTEATLMSNAVRSVETLEYVRRLGILIAIDDFGTGYSSMSYLQRFPIQLLKIDRSFIQNLHSNPNDVSIVRAIISLAHGLQLHVVAEGVERPDQLAVLQRLGCDQYQGFYCSPSVAADQVASLLETTETSADSHQRTTKDLSIT